jgi:ABC-type molybdenum transport system ATPase subunit/photorepair protein PhrA
MCSGKVAKGNKEKGERRKEKNKKRDTADGSSEEVLLTPKEEKKNSNRLSSNIRHTERAQPSFVTMGLHDVEMVFGDETVLRNASFTVTGTTGERVGLVGPNGGGKVQPSFPFLID